MGTTEPEQTEKVRGVIRLAQGTVEVVSDTAYGDTKKRRSLWPLFLLLVTSFAIAFSGGSVPMVGVAVLGLILIALWVGGSGR